MHTAFLLLGSNMGNKIDLLQQACAMLEQQVGDIVQVSQLYKSEPWGFESPDWFINQAIKIDTQLVPQQLLLTTQAIEKTLGRKRRNQPGYASRPIDIDILFYDNEIIETAALVIPHPHLHVRRFALLPLHEIAPNMVHPQMGKTISILLAECPDNSQVDLT